jgi:hypothetical protein
VRQTGVVAFFQQLLRDDRLGLHVDDFLPVLAVDVASGGWNQAKALGLLDLAARQNGQGLGGVDEGVDDEDLSPVALGHLVHLGVGTALDKERVVQSTDSLQTIQEIADELDFEIMDILERQVGTGCPLMARSRGSEGHDLDRHNSRLPDHSGDKVSKYRASTLTWLARYITFVILAR